MRVFPPLPIRADWMPAYLASRGDANRDFAFSAVDAQGAPDRDGRRLHSAVDWFAPGGTVVRAPAAGAVVRVVESRGSTGQVFGGVLEVEEPSGIVWVSRHVDPRVMLGADVPAGGEVATVSRWADGWPHLHLEIHRSRSGGYAHENMIDPRGVEWTAAAVRPEREPAAYWFEELPHDRGGRGPVVLGVFVTAAAARKRAGTMAPPPRARHAADVGSTVAGADGRFYALSWAPGAYGERFRWGPWADREARDRVQVARQENTGRTMRPFKGRGASLYPWPMAG
jgi:murein DD-endopeptidase MepM/ murein hydrolase activator NlpD